jgi:hypothetical protein
VKDKTGPLVGPERLIQRIVSARRQRTARPRQLHDHGARVAAGGNQLSLPERILGRPAPKPDVNYFIDMIKDVKPFPKLRDLRKLLSPTLSLDKINAILKYLERSKLILVDLDGNIVWIKNSNVKETANLSETANFSKEFLEHFGKL